MRRLWDKGVDTNQQVLKFTVGEDFRLDERLVQYDVQASQAHARMLASCGHITQFEADSLCEALSEIQEKHSRGEWHITLEEEDCHTSLELRLMEMLGDLGGKIHLGRSRNDQVLVALRLYLRTFCLELRAIARDVSDGLRQLSAKQGDLPIPGYTHMQRAMPSSVALWAEGFAAEIVQSLHSLTTAEQFLSLNPLGSAAGYGVGSLKLDRDHTTSALGFKESQEPVTSVQLSRGKAEAALAFAAVLIMQDLGRLSSDLCLFATQELALVKLPDAFTTGSSIMPQKRNPDVFELVRGHSAQAIAELNAILLITTKMPSGYHRDLQLLKAPLFRLIDQTLDCLEIMSLAIPEIVFDVKQAGELMSSELFAAGKAYELVQEKGISFREAYRIVAEDFK
ncbi:MAG: argininosuccinate lyase [Armatimonadetes bacterium]|nr:argininosuccinate lyase [Armatimonadota bacterium]